MDTACPGCGTPFICNPGDCWCEHLPKLEKLDAGRGCYCDKCLAALTAAQRSDGERNSAESRPTATSSI
jgi:hypothetical protein